MGRLLDIIIPTFNNPQYLDPCVISIMRTGILNSNSRLIIVNNGSQPLKEKFALVPEILVLDTGKNLGWEGGLKAGLEHSDAEFVCLQNDDTYIPVSVYKIYQRMLTHFIDPRVSAVGPTTTTASGLQTCFHPEPPLVPTEVNWLIFFMVLVRRAHLDAAGGIDTTLPGGDDFDLSIRLRKNGGRLLIDPAAFLVHHGFKTGTRVHGDGMAGVKNGWNSPEMIEQTQQALIRKHGLKTFVSHYYNQLVGPLVQAETRDLEGDIVRSLVTEGSVVELGCGAKKTVPQALGVDRVPKGEKIPNLDGAYSVADVTADVSKSLPFEDGAFDVVIARHILEHCLNSAATLREWNRILKVGGRLIIAVPDEAVTSGIPLNPEHVAAYSQETLADLLDLVGFTPVFSKSAENSTSFVSAFEKVANVAERKEAALA